MNCMFAFHGVDHKVGTTMLTQSVAEMISEYNKELRVMLLHLNGRPGLEYASSIGETVEGIKLYLDNHLLQNGEWIPSCKKSDNLYQLGGIKSVGLSRHFSPASAAYLLDVIADEFDLILVDAGNDLDNGLAVGALEGISNRYCILTQQESMLKRYEENKTLYEQLGFSFSGIIVNKFHKQDPYSLDYMAKRLDFELEKLEKVELTNKDRQAEMEYRTLISFGDSNYNADILLIANHLLTQCNLTPIQSKRTSKWKLFT